MKILAVDLDRSLIAGDLFLESLVQFLKREHAFGAWKVVAWFFRGGVPLVKTKIAERVAVDPATLPYNDDVLNLIKELTQDGWTAVLATGAAEPHAAPISEYLGIFAATFTTEADLNLKGKNKFLRIEKAFPTYASFRYIGDSASDIPLWHKADLAYVVRPSRLLRYRLQLQRISFRDLDEQSAVTTFRKVLKALRAYQWVKNLLILVPVIAAHQLFDSAVIQKSLIGFLAFSFAASSIYIVNDILDIPADRAHARKKNRPLARGDLRLETALILSLCLAILAGVLGWYAQTDFLAALAAYFVITSLYSFRLKQIAVIDVITLACLYGLRVFAGGILTGIVLSKWLITFSLFFFLSLALLKRFSELRLAKSETAALPGRGYSPSDAVPVGIFGIASGYTAALVFSLYLSSPELGSNYQSPSILWLMLPIIVWWISRSWILAFRGQISDDPIEFALKDRPSYVALGAIFLLMMLAMFIG